MIIVLLFVIHPNQLVVPLTPIYQFLFIHGVIIAVWFEAGLKSLGVGYEVPPAGCPSPVLWWGNGGETLRYKDIAYFSLTPANTKA